MVRTRYAPSPTGFMHIGNLRTALYEYLIAKSNNGKFLLRIEDTDAERFVEGATEMIYRTLKVAGIVHDEGPDVGGEYGPYVQSERMGLYIDYAKQLIERGYAYYCFCTKERLAELKVTASGGKEGLAVARYDRHCLSLSAEEIQKKLDEGIPYVIRQKVPNEGSTSFDDVIFGRITVDNDEMEDQILIKSDGMPTYNFANVIDDHLMKISHVVRGSEYLSSTPKYNLLYEGFGWEIPVYIHLSTIMKNSTEKLSKRNGDASFEDLVAKGYLPQAIVNYIALLGWSPRGNQELFTMEEMIENFSIEGLSKSPSIFDIVKLSWMNAQYIAKMDFGEFFELALPRLCEVISNPDVDLKKVAALIQTRISTLNEIGQKSEFLQTLPDYDTALYVHKKMKTTEENSLQNLKDCIDVLESLTDWNEQQLHDTLIAHAQKMEIKNGQLLWPIRTALSGLESSPGGAIELLDILGKKESMRRITIGIDMLKRI